MTGIGWAIVAAVSFGLFQTLNRRASQDTRLDAARGTFIMMLVSAVMLIIIATIRVGLDVLFTASWLAVLYFGLAGFIHFFMGVTLLNISQGRIGAARTSAVFGTVPLFGLVADLVIYRETFSPMALLGVGFVVVGVYIISHR